MTQIRFLNKSATVNSQINSKTEIALLFLT